MGDKLIMSAKERHRNVILEQLKQSKLTLGEASEQMGVSYRQGKRLWKRYKTEGVKGLIHRSRCKPSGHAYSKEYKAKLLKLYQEKYLDFGPTLAAEMFDEEDKVEINPETLRLWLKASGLWVTHRKRKSYRKRRQRKERFGEMVQIDGSDHRWLGEDEPRCCLLNIVDDATGVTLSRLDTGETTYILLTTLKRWIERYGIPIAVYVDLKSLYISPKRLKLNLEDALGEDSWSVFEKVCQKLGIKIIKAYSAQAKGRVERNHGVYQDRLVKMLELKKIRTLEGANDYLENGFIEKLNNKFAVKALSSEDAHRSKESYGDLEQIFCFEYTRQVKLDWTIQFKNQHYQLLKQSARRIQAKQKIKVRVHLDGKLTFWNGTEQVRYERLEHAPKKMNEKVEVKGYDNHQRSQQSKRSKHNTPWSYYNPGWLKGRRKSTQIGCI